MHPLIQALFSAWEWRLEISVTLLALGSLYSAGWLRLRARSAQGRGIATVWRLAAYWGGLIVLATSLMSPIDALGGQLFFMHMIQHLLSIMVAAPLLWLASPFPISLWGLPVGLRRALGRQFARGAPLRRGLAFGTRPALAWLIFLTVFLGWHDPNLYGLALRRDWAHDLQHITFFLAALLFWWHVVGAAPRLHGRFPAWARMGYLILMVPPNMLAGVAIAFTGQVIYTYYASVPRVWGFTVLEDQMLGGVIMWIPGSMMYIAATLILLATMLRKDGVDGPEHLPDWDRDEAMVAPGLEHRVLSNK